jgi:hypothetical protein
MRLFDLQEAPYSDSARSTAFRLCSPAVKSPRGTAPRRLHRVPVRVPLAEQLQKSAIPLSFPAV